MGAWGALLLILPLITLGVLVANLRGVTPTAGEPPQAPDPRVDRAVDVWLGRAVMPQGGELSVSLTRLHGDPVVQAFDSRCLTERFDLGRGEPWHLELYWAAAPVGAEAVELLDLEIQDATDRGLIPFANPETPTADQIVDPLRVLLAAPETLEPGQLLSLVLWGEEPRGRANLRGLGTDLQLTSDSIRAPARGSILASLDRDDFELGVMNTAPADTIPAESMSGKPSALEFFDER